jgi:hypothetical protein
MVGGIILLNLGMSISNLSAKYFNITSIKSIPNSGDFIKANGLWLSVFSMVVYAPLIEELGFRFWLKFTPHSLGISLGALAIILTKHFTVFFTLEWFALSVCNFIVVYFLSKYISSMFIVSNFAFNSTSLYFFSSISFGVAHLTNYDLTKYNWVVCLPLIFPQIFTGFLFSHLRVKYSFKESVLLHSLINLSSWMAALF